MKPLYRLGVYDPTQSESQVTLHGRRFKKNRSGRLYARAAIAEFHRRLASTLGDCRRIGIFREVTPA